MKFLLGFVLGVVATLFTGAMAIFLSIPDMDSVDYE